MSYDEAAVERWISEPPKRPGRTVFERDRARILHSAALRRLAAKTQIFVAGESDFPRTRLTHSLECAQIGRELGKALGADPDLVEASCLAHDLGHPPFGHAGEAALNEVARLAGGFEGNAQSLRILTRLEAKTFSLEGRSVGLNLTRATLDAATKYPWPKQGDMVKYGVYADDNEIFSWLRQGAPFRRRCFEAQVMDWADDVAYSVHDLEDALYAGHFAFDQLADFQERQELTRVAAARYAPDAAPAELDEALQRLRAQPYWPAGYDGSLRAQASLKNATSQLIGRFFRAARQATHEIYGNTPLRRYHADLIIPRHVRLECAVLKAITAHYVMTRVETTTRWAWQQELIAELSHTLFSGAPTTVDPVFRSAFQAADSDAARLRVVVDQVASLTDTSAVALRRRLVAGARTGSGAISPDAITQPYRKRFTT